MPGFESVRNRLDWDFLGKYMFCMLLQGSIFFIATLLIEYRVWTVVLAMRKKYYIDGDLDDDGNELDEDVVEERNRVYSDSNSDVLQVKNLFKKYEIFYLTHKKIYLLRRYRRNAKPAVNCLTFGVQRAECFGLLGETEENSF